MECATRSREQIIEIPILVLANLLSATFYNAQSQPCPAALIIKLFCFACVVPQKPCLVILHADIGRRSREDAPGVPA